ncbi:hypothetical protein ACFQ49_04215 [Kroppenstedtia eburnea]|uniref:Uncharacterized protein n=1 Tax=Kroppenstedtia eburnea TaxID=714067 RepID=A0A1N7J380_9BACL|nr:hypothetical protein [Kroppenstedtia eburnea]EGK13300.1 hypothetical protein HMPREF9374_0969 [Desmospora sp. 8437]SIS43813.1 hypothetical protein SAMN05421790_101672 [Kroppenstedtia eburnea]
MALTDLPAIKPSKGVNFLFTAFLVVFIFFFTQPKSTDVSPGSNGNLV